MTSILTRRSLLRGLFAMPAVVAASSLMPVRGIVVPISDEFVVRGFDMYGQVIEERCRLYRIRDVLLPGVLDMRGSYNKIPVDWDTVFKDAA